MYSRINTGINGMRVVTNKYNANRCNVRVVANPALETKRFIVRGVANNCIIRAGANDRCPRGDQQLHIVMSGGCVGVVIPRIGTRAAGRIVCFDEDEIGSVGIQIEAGDR